MQDIERAGCSLPDRQHALDGAEGTPARRLRHLNLLAHLLKTCPRVLQRDLVHVWAALPAHPQHLLLRILRHNVLAHRALGEQKVPRRVGLLHVLNHGRGAARVVRRLHDLRAALGVRQDDGVGVLLADALDVLNAELVVHLAAPVPPDELDARVRVGAGERAVAARRGENDVLARLLRHVLGQVLVGQEDDGVAVERFDNGGGVGPAGRSSLTPQSNVGSFPRRSSSGSYNRLATYGRCVIVAVLPAPF